MGSIRNKLARWIGSQPLPVCNEDLRKARKGESTFMNWDIFRAYDIRGVYPDDIDEAAYYRIAKAYTYLFRPTKMVVGMDARESSPKLKDALVSGFVDAGVNVVDIGGITTDMLYFAVGASDDYSGGVVVSASPNPKQYKGAKMGPEKTRAMSS